jgi:hypothetical protein
MKVQTRDCNPDAGYGWPKDLYKHWFGHAPHAFFAGIGPFRRAYRCRGSQPIEVPPTREELIIRELRRIADALEKE